jgi:hypothetical protein
VISLLVVVTACGDDDGNAVATDGPDPTEVSSTDPTDAAGASTSTSDRADDGPDDGTRHEWCATWAELRASTDEAPAELPDAVASAPDAVRADIERLAESESASGGPAPASFVRSFAAVEAWSHEQCGTGHPFCVAWPAFTFTLASSAFADEADRADLQAQIPELAAVALGHVPAELAHVAAAVESTLEGAESDADERAAESAYDELDAWVETNCNG